MSDSTKFYKSRRDKLLLAVIVVALALTSAFVLSVAPNPLVKNRPWISVEGISFNVSYEINIFTGAVEGTTVYSFLMITIHNPTHRTPTIELRLADLHADISYLPSPSSTISSTSSDQRVGTKG